MDLTSERDPLFARYEAAWRDYQAVQEANPAARMPYKQAMTQSSNPAVRAAATSWPQLETHGAPVLTNDP